MPAPKAFVFDLDGTLIDSLADLAGAINQMLVARGFPIRELSVFPEFIGDGVRALVERALPEGFHEETFILQCVTEYQQHYEKGWRMQTQVYAGMLNTLTQLKASGIRLACISNKPHYFTELCCAHFFPEGTFERVLGHRAEVPKKPDPAGAFELAEAMGLKTEEMAYIGDSGIDMQFATNSGMRAVGVTWGFRSEKELRETGAEVLVHRPEELLTISFPAR